MRKFIATLDETRLTPAARENVRRMWPDGIPVDAEDERDARNVVASVCNLDPEIVSIEPATTTPIDNIPHAVGEAYKRGALRSIAYAGHRGRKLKTIHRTKSIDVQAAAIFLAQLVAAGLVEYSGDRYYILPPGMKKALNK